MSDQRPIARRHLPAIALAWAAAAWERVWPVLWLPSLIALGYLGLALLGVPPALGFYGHWALNLGVLAALLILLIKDGRSIRLPRWAEAVRRVERESDLPHRPLTSRGQAQATGLADSGAAALWQRHSENLTAQRLRLRPKLPRPNAGSRDEIGARGAVGLVLVAGLIVTGGEIAAPLARALAPQAPSLTGAPAVPQVADVYITPPRYTGVAPIYRSHDLAGEAAPAPITAPAGSEVLVRLSGQADAPAVRLAGAQAAMDPVDARNFEATLTVVASGDLALSDGATTLAEWPLTVVPDTAPTVSFTEEPAPTARQSLPIAWQTQDDYGAAEIALTMTPDPDGQTDWPAGLSQEPETITLAEPARPEPEDSGTSFQNLTPHPWAGLPVTMRLTATDQAGNQGESEAISLILPQRQFTHPVAAAIADQRLRLLRDPSRAPIVSDVLRDLSVRPDRFNDDIVVFLGLRTAARRLDLASDVPATVTPVTDLLWELALRLEDGGLSLAAARVREAQEALQRALESDADSAEIAELTEELRQAMEEYAQALAEDLQRRMAEGELPEMGQFDPDSVVTSDQIQEMMDRIEELSQAGEREAAQELLSQLQQMMENLELGMMPMPQGPNPAMEMLEDLESLTRAQQELMDRSFQEGQRRENGQEADPRFDEDAEQVQEALRRQLGDVMQRFAEMTGDLPQEMGQAELAMREAEQALGEGNPSRATAPQGEALELLTEGMQSMLDQMAEQFAQQGLMPIPGQAMPRRQPGEDPLGRRMEGEGGFSGQDVEVPSESVRERARSILEELRRRAGERGRPAEELDYIDRLLERF